MRVILTNKIKDDGLILNVNENLSKDFKQIVPSNLQRDNGREFGKKLLLSYEI